MRGASPPRRPVSGALPAATHTVAGPKRQRGRALAVSMRTGGPPGLAGSTAKHLAIAIGNPYTVDLGDNR